MLSLYQIFFYIIFSLPTEQNDEPPHNMFPNELISCAMCFSTNHYPSIYMLKYIKEQNKSRWQTTYASYFC